MARKHSNPKDVPPASSSSEEEEEEQVVDDQDKEDDLPNALHDESESEEEGEDDDEEGEDDDEEDDEEDDDDEKQVQKNNQSLQRPSQPKAITKSLNQQEEEEDEDESETESESDSKAAHFSIRPHSSDPANISIKDSASVKLKKPTENPSKEKEKEKEKESHHSSVSVILKRPAEGDIETNSKKKKVRSDNGEQGVVAEKKPAFSRLWSEEDEIAVLKGMIEFHGKKGVDPNSDSTAFHEFVKKNISVDVSKSQLMEKVKRLKAKYRNNIEKGDNLVFSKPHEIKVFELSKRVWGDLVNASNNKASKKKNLVVENANPELVMALPKAETFQAVKSKKNKLNQQQEERNVEEGKFSDLYPFLNMSLKMDSFLMSQFAAEGMKSCLVSLEKSKLDELEKEWEKQILDEAQVKLGRSALLKKQVQLVSEWCSKRG